jgi:hypothetical protein
MKNIYNMRYYILGFLIIIAVSCCDTYEYETNINLSQLRNEWEREYEAWKKLDIQNYRFTFLPYYLISPDGQITIVKKGQFYEAIDLKTGYQIEIEEVRKWMAITIDDRFSSINKHFDEDEKKNNFSKSLIGRSFKVKYDPDYHFPAFFSVTHIYKYKHKHIGEEDVYVIDDFTIIDE